jgi:hypothetical protein
LGFPERLAAVRERVARAARRAGRSPAEVRLLGASKTVPVERLVEASRHGLVDFGENRVQEARAKVEAWPAAEAAPTWHLIGHLQSNKAKGAVRLFDWIHSVDSASLGRELNRRAGEAGRTPFVLVEVNTTGEATKQGVEPPALEPLLVELLGLTHLRVRGLMTMGPLGGEPEAARAAFRRLRGLRESARRCFPGAALEELSMGMSGDYEAAIEEGATWVRLGTALFGPRP